MTQVLADKGGVEYHAKKIESALREAQSARFAVIARIHDAYNELGDATFQKDLADRLGISAPQLSKYVRIAQCSALMSRSGRMPETLTTLYELSRLETEMTNAYGEKSGLKRFAEFLDKHVTPSTEAKQVSLVVAKAKAVAKQKKQAKREENILSLDGRSVQKGELSTRIVRFDELLKKKTVFRTIFVDLPDDDMVWAARPDVLSSDIADKYPIAELRAPSVAVTLTCFVLCEARHFDGGLKVLEAAGCEFRDFFAPSNGEVGFTLLRKQQVLLRGERGSPVVMELNQAIEADDQGAFSIAEMLGEEPRLLISNAEPRKGWTCLNPQLR